jgi:hypothetical protein
MRLHVLIVFHLSVASFAYGQENSEEKNSYNLSVNFGMGITRFTVSGFDTEDYPAMGTRLGFGISKTVIGRFQVASGINIYFRAKSKSPLVDRIYWYRKGSLLPTLNETATQRHIAFELPISVRYLLDVNWSVNTGLIIRQWGPKDHNPLSLLASQTELVYTFGLKQQVTEHFSVGLDFYIGFKDFYPGGVIGSPGNIVIKNRSALLSLAYAF